MFQEKIIELLSKETSLKNELIEEILEIPPRMELGDFSFPCFALIKKYKKKPVEIAQYLQKKFSEKLIKELEKIESKGPYLNFFINKQLLAKEILQINASFGKQNIGKKKKLVIDFSQPNIGKPMHVGHIRSTILGDSLMRIYNFLNYFPIGVNYLGDVGLHIGKLIVAYELWLDKKALQKDPVKELLRLYFTNDPTNYCSKKEKDNICNYPTENYGYE